MYTLYFDIQSFVDSFQHYFLNYKIIFILPSHRQLTVMDLRHIFFFLFFFSNQKLGQGKKKSKDLLYMIKLSRNVLFLEKKLVICWAFETIIQLPVFTKETVKSSIKETPQVYFLGWKTELEYLGTRYQESTEHNFPLNAGGNPNIHNQK